jgi:hypothetical protein
MAGTTAFYKLGKGKDSKSEANYRRKTGNIDCGDCVHMNPDGTCQVVVGTVDAGHVCDYWEAEHEPRD